MKRQCKSFFLAIMALLILAVSTCQPVYAADFQPVFKKSILPHEGGLSMDRNDPGNWTGGKVGKGKLLGTNRGIAANTYGAELLRKGRTIKGLSEAECGAFYKRDYWDACHLGELKSQGIADELMDEVVNMGTGGGRVLLAKVFGELSWAMKKPVPVPPSFSPVTIAWINAYTKERDNRVAFYNSLRIKRVRYYVKLAEHKPSLRRYILSWADRATD